MTTRIELAFRAETAEDATAQAREWARAELRLRLRTIASCRRHQAELPGAWAPLWTVTVVVNDVVPA